MSTFDTFKYVLLIILEYFYFSDIFNVGILLGVFLFYSFANLTEVKDLFQGFYRSFHCIYIKMHSGDKNTQNTQTQTKKN